MVASAHVAKLNLLKTLVVGDALKGVHQIGADLFDKLASFKPFIIVKFGSLVSRLISTSRGERSVHLNDELESMIDAPLVPCVGVRTSLS